ncbi:phosphopantetheine-binding protein [Crenothrix polyspora]|uniref:phosphopantetheine-binding protein n=1 Tax=Crenothrix polyspora TaxID=360316 RepID=UPI001FE29330|nr:phosphopantetheine-binding protein [Crenothrix polyspora]
MQSPETIDHLTMESALLGAVPEMDSMAVVSILTALEEQYGFFVDDDEIDATVFETVGSLVKFVEYKVGVVS